MLPTSILIFRNSPFDESGKSSGSRTCTNYLLRLSMSQHILSKRLRTCNNFLTSWMVGSWSSSQCRHFLLVANMAKGPSREPHSTATFFWAMFGFLMPLERAFGVEMPINSVSKTSVSNHARAVFEALGCFRWLPKKKREFRFWHHFMNFYD